MIQYFHYRKCSGAKYEETYAKRMGIPLIASFLFGVIVALCAAISVPSAPIPETSTTTCAQSSDLLAEKSR